MKTSTEKGARGRTDLMRREKVQLEERMDRGGNEEPLFEGAKKVEFQYWDSFGVNPTISHDRQLSLR